jgi:hypothetical protein
MNQYVIICLIVCLLGCDVLAPPNRNPTFEQTSIPQIEEPRIPIEYRNALRKAASYATRMHMSKQGVYDQLVSEYGEQFSLEAAQYAVENVQADWNKNALMKARRYQEHMNMSRKSIREQLVSEYGEKFTEAEANYAIQNL